MAVERLVSVTAEPPTRHTNGDVAQYLDVTFLCRHLTGDAVVGDDEANEVAWVGVAELPDMKPYLRRRIDRALEPATEPWFHR